MTGARSGSSLEGRPRFVHPSGRRAGMCRERSRAKAGPDRPRKDPGASGRSERLATWRLEGCTLYVTLEPCAMCAGAIVLARVDRLVFGASDEKAGFAGSLGDLVRDPRLNHSVELESGVLARECSNLLRAFFRDRR